jgi:hypothetical protein
MKRPVTLLSLFAVCALTTSALAANPVRISQVYGGGGATTAGPTYNQDYVELFNSGLVPVDVSGWTIEYGSATGNWGSSTGNIFTFPAGSIIEACRYVLVAMTASSAGGPLPVTPDYSGTLTMSATNGKVALFSAVNSNLACGAELPGTLVDKVAYGTANCAETAAVAALVNTTGAVRNSGGMDDTDDNAADFTVVTAPVPNNRASAPNPLCLATPSRGSTWGQIKTLYR